MKKLFLTSAIIGVFALPTYATTVTGTGTECTEPVLNTDTGPATLQAQWTANTINLEWYNDNEKITPSNGTANTCTYDSSITLPTNNPTKEGYTFGGWQVRVAQQCLPSNFNYDGSISTTGYTRLDGSAGSKETDYGLTTGSGEWAVDYGNAGVIKGMAKCSETGGTFAQTGTPSNTDGVICWCQITGYDANKDKEYCPVASPSWVLRSAAASASACAYWCANECAGVVQYNSGFRAALFGQVM